MPDSISMAVLEQSANQSERLKTRFLQSAFEELVAIALQSAVGLDFGNDDSSLVGVEYKCPSRKDP